ncbi:MAG: hypothetical protein ACR5K5_05320, partial [Wolbachia sp.]
MIEKRSRDNSTSFFLDLKLLTYLAIFDRAAFTATSPNLVETPFFKASRSLSLTGTFNDLESAA